MINLKEIFLPEMIGSRRILAQRIAGLTIQDDTISLALVQAKRNKTLVEQLITETITPGENESLADSTKGSLALLLPHLKGVDKIRVCIPASIVVFKELHLQFTDPEKIRMVLDYEIESMLPFSIHEAIVDFIITDAHKDKEKTQVLVAAVRTSDLHDYLATFTNAGINPTNLTIDLLANYSLYQQIPAYAQQQQTNALIKFGAHTTRIAFIQNGQLRLTRSIQRGVNTILQLVHDETKLPLNVIEQELATHGIRGGDEPVARALQQHFTHLLNDVQFTLNSFSLKLGHFGEITQLLCTGRSRTINNFMTFCSNTLQIPCNLFDYTKIFENSLIKNKLKEKPHDGYDFTTALGAALPSPQQHDFDLRRNQFTFYRGGLIKKQLIAGVSLVLGLLLIIGIRGYTGIHALSTQAQKLEQQEIARLKTANIVPRNRPQKNKTLVVMIKDAERLIKEKTEIWASFSKDRMNPLALLLELTRILTIKQFTIVVKTVSITTENNVPTVKVEGTFKSKIGSHFSDYDGFFVKRFQESPVFKVSEQEGVPAPDGGVNFTITLTLKVDPETSSG